MASIVFLPSLTDKSHFLMTFGPISHARTQVICAPAFNHSGSSKTVRVESVQVATISASLTTCSGLSTAVTSISNLPVISLSNRERFAREMTGKLDIEVTAVDKPEQVVKEADIVATCTDSTRTVFDEPEWLKAGAHITCVRACEMGPKVIQKCDLSVKLGKNTIEAMDEGMIRLHGNVGYIAGQPEERARIPNPTVDNYKGDYFKYFMDVRAGRVPGRTNNKQVTFFINAGTQGLQFAACAGKVVELAKQKKIGRELPTEWFLQDIRD